MGKDKPLSTVPQAPHAPRMLDKVFVRNYALFLALLLTCAGVLIYTLIAGNITIDKISKSVKHTHDVITEAQQLFTLVEGMLASQRGYIITGQDSFLNSYTLKKQNLSRHLDDISALVKHNPAQAARVQKIREYYTQFSRRLDDRAAKYVLQSANRADFLNDVQLVNDLKERMLSLNDEILQDEYALLKDKVERVEMQKSRYFVFLLIGLVVASSLLLLLNGILLALQRKRSSIETSLKDRQQRFSLAVEGTQDGIFDWDVKTGEVFYSGQFFRMLGYDRSSFTGTVEDSKNILHPEDTERVFDFVERYFKGEIQDYAQEFRMKSADGQWIWVQSRAKAIYDREGLPIRLVGAHTDISHVKERQEKLEAEKSAAEAANRAKSDFLAHMSHEIRTPLTAITGIAEIFHGNQDNLDERQRKLVRTLRSSTASLKDLVNDILDFSKIESGELDLHEESFKLAPLFEEISSMMALRAAEKGIDFFFHYGGIGEIGFAFDRQRLRQIIVNLIGNALKFTHQGHCMVRAFLQNEDNVEYLRIDVTDTGIGIAPENFDLIFERFKQADPTVSRKYGGTGLGLPISRNLARLMGGDIHMSSKPQQGSTFSLVLPVKILTRHAPEDKSGDRGEASSLHPQAPCTAEKRILLAEDYEGNVIILTYMLEKIGCVCDIARNGEEAVELWRSGGYDLILMDVQMPVMDGFTATMRIRNLEAENALPRTPIIGITAHALVGDKDKCIKAGMDSYLPKPIDEQDLKTQISYYFHRTPQRVQET